MQRTLSTVLTVSLLVLLLPNAMLSEPQAVRPIPARTADAMAPQSSPTTPAQGSHAAARRVPHPSYQQGAHSRRHPKISKKEVAFMAAIAGTSMGIGALAGGGKGLAIGAIVGGWAAYAGHRLWKWLR